MTVFAAEKTLYGSIRQTTRQTFQFHGVLKPNIKTMHQLFNATGIDSITTAGDVNRNVLYSTNPVKSELHQEACEWAKKISENLLPKTKAYMEVWLDGKKEKTTEEPILGSTYLPRKFKTTVTVLPNNEVDVHANDLNFIAIVFFMNGRSWPSFRRTVDDRPTTLRSTWRHCVTGDASQSANT